MNRLGRFFWTIIRFIVVWLIDALSILVTAWILPGVSVQAVGEVPSFVVATSAALLLGIVNLLVRPVLLLIALPLGWIVVFLAGFFVNAAVLMITASLMTGFTVDGWWSAFLGGLLLSLVNTILTQLFSIDDDESFYQNLVERRAARQVGEIQHEDGRGLVMLEIDGLSYWHIEKAVEDGYMPHVKRLIDEAGYQITRIDCGLPATTPACQAGILQGNNTNIPAFRWLDKSTGKLLAGGQAAALIEPELSDGKGLLHGGSSIANMFSGDAAKSILTFSKIQAGSKEDKKKRAQDMYLLMRDPYFFVRVLVLFFGDVFQEVWQGWQQRRKDVQPRLNRLHNGYPFLRAATNVFLRDVGAYLTILDIVRGTPAIYTLFAGYDEVAHHSGPWTKDAMLTLGQFDRVIGKILMAIERKAPRPYEFILLSDHGQSFGATFKQRYDISILEFIKQQLPQDISLVETSGGDDGTMPVAAMMQELESIENQGLAGRIGQSVVGQTKRAINRNLEQQPSQQEVEPAKVTLCYSGNLAQVYFDLAPRKITLNELNAAYPGMVDALVHHEGIGFVVAYEDDGEPVAFGKQGARNLHTGDVVGEDPLAPFGDIDLRSWQVRRIADFPNAGDLIINSTFYSDGTVAAMEELIGNHGGLGGEQTDAFILHPGDMIIPETRNSYEVRNILAARRGLPGPTPLPETDQAAVVNAWSFGNLAKGLGQVQTWLGLAAQSIALHREAFRAIARDALMTGPALLIFVIAQVLLALNTPDGLAVVTIIVRVIGWFVAVLGMTLGAWALRGKGTFTSTLRVSGFANSAYILELLVFIPVIGPLAHFIAQLLVFFATWIGVATAHEIRGWRTLVLPVIYLLVLVVGVVFIAAIIRGTAFTFESLLMTFGLTGQ